MVFKINMILHLIIAAIAEYKGEMTKYLNSVL